MSKYSKEAKVRRLKYNKQWALDNKEHVASYYLNRKFGITLEQYNELLTKQDFKCAICGSHISEFKKRLHVDHCHSTGEIRGLLCFCCNSLLGHAKDDIIILEQAINYLNK